MTEYFATNLKALMDKAGISPYELAHRIGTEPSTIYRWLDPEVRSIPRTRTRVVIGDFFGVDPNKIVYEELDVNSAEKDVTSIYKSKANDNRIPLVEAESGLAVLTMFDDDVSSVTDDLAPGAKKWLPGAPDESLNANRLVAIYAQNNAVAPEVCKGDLVYVDFNFAEQGSSAVDDGDLVLAVPNETESTDSAAVIRQLVYGENERDLWLKATNPDWPGNRMLRCRFVLGKVVAIFRKLPA